MGGKKMTKQAEITMLQNSLRGATQRIEEGKKKLDEADSRRAKLSEEKHALEEQVQYLEKKYESTFETLMITRHNFEASQVALTHWWKQATDTQKEILRRGFRRAQHDPEFAIVRELIHSNGKLDADQVIAMCKQHPEADLRRMVGVADEFGLRLKFDMVSKDLKKTEVPMKIEGKVWTYEDPEGKYTSKIEVNEMFASVLKDAHGDQKD